MQNIAPMKVRILMWLVAQNKLLTADNLSKRNIRVRNICVFCNRQRESVIHHFVHCPAISIIWEFVKKNVLSMVCLGHSGLGGLIGDVRELGGDIG